VTVAKITPCFENGKGAVMRGLLGGFGFGTTELVVARPLAGETTSDYLHWLFISTPFRKLGEASMYGAGGQKRMPDDFVRNFKVAIPPLPEQQTIAAFLDRETGKIDDMIKAVIGNGVGQTIDGKSLVGLLKERRSALISAAVTGKIRVIASDRSDPSDLSEFCQTDLSESCQTNLSEYCQADLSVKENL
jgi:type I restriction enzyme S subunit